MIYESELYHFGVKGMHWGVRRFQNKDGSLTTKGKKRYGPDYEKLTPQGRKAFAVKASQDRYKGVKEFGNETANITRNSGSLLRNRAARQTKTKDLSHMTDQELRQKINRIQMEHQYQDLMVDDTMRRKGYDKVSNILRSAGDVAMIGSSVAGLALAISKFKHGGGK